MKIVSFLISFFVAASACFAADPVWRVLKTNDTVAAEVLDTGAADFNGAVSVDSLSSGGALSATTISLSASNTLTSTHPVIGAGTNTTAAGGIRVTVNGTNYIIRLFAN